MHSFCNTKFQQTDSDVSNNNWQYGKAYGLWKIRSKTWVIFDSRLSFQHHIKSMCSRLNGTLSYLNRVKNTLDKKSRILQIYALIFSHLNYCSSIWSKCSEKLQYEVQKCIIFAAKVPSNWKYLKRDHVKPLLGDFKWININSILRLKRHPLCIKICICLRILKCEKY